MGNCSKEFTWFNFHGIECFALCVCVYGACCSQRADHHHECIAYYIAHNRQSYLESRTREFHRIVIWMEEILGNNSLFAHDTHSKPKIDCRQPSILSSSTSCQFLTKNTVDDIIYRCPSHFSSCLIRIHMRFSQMLHRSRIRNEAHGRWTSHKSFVRCALLLIRTLLLCENQ